MLSKDQLKEIREHLERAQNPLFLYDNDADGLCSYLILKRELQRGKGVAIKSFPNLSIQYLARVEEFNSDYVFVLDCSEISREFIEGLQEKNIPLVIIDHHESSDQKYLKENAEIFSTFPSSEPTTYICQKIYERKASQWIALIGCISDVFKPDFAEEFAEENPEIYNSSLTPFETLYKTELGKIAMMLNYGLKDTTTNVVKLMKYMEKANNPSDILVENKETINLHKKFRKVNEYIEKMSKKVRKIDDKMLLLEYSGENSMSSEISNYLLSKNKDKFILVSYMGQGNCNVSIRGKRSKEILAKAIKGIEGASGGGHEEACGARIPTDKWEEFKEKVIRELTSK
ncbi:DHHA1 domain protein [uncultured archaeon]|nr:DHHA1 domain protein [uncultured archaeon]